MYDINYDDDRFKEVEQQKQDAITDAENTYNSMIDENDKVYQEQKDLVDKQAQEQKDLQQQQHELAMEELAVGQQKQEKAYENEQKSAYVDYQQKSANNHTQNQYNHLSRTGYDSSSDREIYSTYQSRLESAFQTISEARTNYDLAKKDAVLQNSSALLKIAQEAAQKSLELTLQQFQYKNTLITELFNQKQTIDNNYYNRYQDVLSQINTENTLAESIRQYEQNLAYQKERDRIADEQWQKTYELSKKSAAAQNAYYQSLTNNPVITEDNTQTSGKPSGAPDDYYFDANNDGDPSNDYQPRYVTVNGKYVKLAKTKNGNNVVTATNINRTEYGKNKTVWQIGNTGKYVIWTGSTYADVTDDYLNKYGSKSSAKKSTATVPGLPIDPTNSTRVM